MLGKAVRSLAWVAVVAAALYYIFAAGLFGLGVMGALSHPERVPILCEHPDPRFDSNYGSLKWSAVPPGWHCEWPQSGERQFKNLLILLAPAIAVGGLAYWLVKTTPKH